MDQIETAKLALRDQLLAARKQLSVAEIGERARALATHLLAAGPVRRAAMVAAYVSVGREPGTGPLLEGLRAAGKRVISASPQDGQVTSPRACWSAKASLEANQPSKSCRFRQRRLRTIMTRRVEAQSSARSDGFYAHPDPRPRAGSRDRAAGSVLIRTTCAPNG